MQEVFQLTKTKKHNTRASILRNFELKIVEFIEDYVWKMDLALI